VHACSTYGTFTSSSRYRRVYDALFHAAQRTLLEMGQRRFQGTLGATLVLHTWTRELSLHPHVHAIVTAGGLSNDGTSWKPAPKRYLFPVEAMGLVFRAKMLQALNKAYGAHAFRGFEDFDDPEGFTRLMQRAARPSWNVYAKAPFAEGKHVLAYLGRYTHRVGIANSRLRDVSPQAVTFRTKGEGTKTLSPVEFLRRLVHHVLPEGFHKIRHVGLYAPAAKERRDEARARLGATRSVDLATAPRGADGTQRGGLPAVRRPPRLRAACPLARPTDGGCVITRLSPLGVPPCSFALGVRRTSPSRSALSSHNRAPYRPPQPSVLPPALVADLRAQ